jgi:hypothetical protein
MIIIAEPAVGVRGGYMNLRAHLTSEPKTLFWPHPRPQSCGVDIRIILIFPLPTNEYDKVTRRIPQPARIPFIDGHQ